MKKVIKIKKILKKIYSKCDLVLFINM
jgi:hypothetical protein